MSETTLATEATETVEFAMPLRMSVGLVLAAVFLGGCSGFISSSQPVTLPPQEQVISSSQSVGQTFVARHAGLNGLQIYLANSPGAAGNLVLTLRREPDASAPILTQGSLDLREVKFPGFYTIPFTTQTGSSQTYYYAAVRWVGQGEVRLGANSADAYLDGAMYEDEEPLEAQMVFKLMYEPIWMAWGLIGEAMVWVLMVAVGINVLILPGWAIIKWLGLSFSGFRWLHQVGLAIAVSVTIYPILMLITYLVGLQLGALYVWLPVSVGWATLIWEMRRQSPSALWYTFREWRSGAHFQPDLTCLLLLALIVAVRFWIIRNLDAPMWNDSFHHMVIAQLMIDHGGLFQSWAPYAPFETFTYHFGFHSLSAVVHWMTGLDIPKTVLWTGQLVNVAAIIVLTPLTRYVGGGRWTDAAVLLVAGLLAPMPNAYTNWGRYTQLAGQTILPVVMVQMWDIFKNPTHRWKRLVVAWLTIGGLGLTHFRILIFAVLFIGIAWCLEWRRNAWKSQAFQLGLAGFGASIVFLPWLLITLKGNITTGFVSGIVTPPASRLPVLEVYNAIVDWREFLPVAVWAAMFAALVWALWQRRKSILLIMLWWGGLILVANPQWLGLPGEGSINNFAVQIFSYGPAAAIVGVVAGDLSQKNSWREAGLLLLIFALACWGVVQRSVDLRLNERVLVTRPDLRAMEWIKENLPRDAILLVNGRYENLNTYVVGTDGAWLTPLFAGRQVTIPPMVYQTEQLSAGWMRERIENAVDAVLQQGRGNPDWKSALQATGARYIFVGQRHGQVLNENPVFDIDRLLRETDLRVVYRHDRVWIFEWLRGP